MPPAKPHVHPNGENQHDATGDEFPLGWHGHECHAVQQAGDDEGAEQDAQHIATTAAQADATDHTGGDGIQLENGTPSQILGTPEAGPSIATDRARTEVQVSDGATTVIGGIVQTNEETRSSRTPGVSRLPLFGWLFKNNSNSTLTQELLIFITPRIIRG